MDLANAYGSVRHNLIQFALNWFHIPKQIQEIIFDYYDKICAFIKTKNWTTGFFLFDIGLFQGCVLSTIIFDCVFQLHLDFLHPKNRLGYIFKSTPSVSTLAKAYADDLTLSTRNTDDMQLLVDLTVTWLKWTDTMRAKPTKCVSLGCKLFDKRTKNERFTPLQQTVYSPFDPRIVVDGQPMKFIVDAQEKEPFKAKHFKFLGRWLNPSLTETDIKEKIKASLLKDMDLIASSKLRNGFMKLWLYQFYALSHLSWPLMIHDLDRSFALDLQAQIQSTLKKWAGIGRSADSGLMFRSKKNFGLGITPISDFYQRMQLVKCELLRNSADPNIQKLYQTRQRKNASVKRVWKAMKLSWIFSSHHKIVAKALDLVISTRTHLEKKQEFWSSKKQFLSLKTPVSFILTLSNNNQLGCNGQN